MIGVLFIGRLGNQLFQFCFLQYLKSRNKKYIYFFVNPHHAYLARYFDLGWRNNLILNSKLYSVISRSIPRIFRFNRVYIENIAVPKQINVTNHTIYKGFFQSDFYLNQTPGNSLFRIKKKYINEFEQSFGDLFRNEKTIVVHIRRTDYLTYGKRDISLPADYFKRRLDALGNIDSFKVLFVSDDMEFVKKEFPARPNFIFTSNSEIIDFQIIKNADIAIISNSTFAWWACYLSDKKQEVYAPKNWLGFRIGKEHPKGIMTTKFIWTEVL